MEISSSSVASISSTVSQSQTGDSVGISVLKKALDIEAQAATQLLQALPTTSSNPPYLGNSVDIKV